MPDPLAEAGAHPVPFFVALATSVTGALIGAFRISGRISAEEAKSSAIVKRVEEAEKSIGKLFDENAALRAEVASLRGEAAKIETDMRREVAEIEGAVERGMKSHATVKQTLSRLQKTLAQGK